MTIPVIWYEGVVGADEYSAQFSKDVGAIGRSRYACCGILNLAFDSYGDLFQHYSGWNGIPRIPDYAVVVIHGGHLRYLVDQINENIQQLQGVLLIGIGDEENDFPYHLLWHRNMKLWMQSPIPGKSRADRFPVVGFPVDCQEHLIHGQERIYDFSFCGQVTHVRREQCVESARNLRNGYLLETKQFYSGLEHAEYFKILGQSKIVLSPSGPVHSDCFRTAEALEAGAIPICDDWPGWKDKPTTGIFDMLFPADKFGPLPFPIMSDWENLPGVMEGLLKNYDYHAKQCRDFWVEYKRQYFSWLGTDLRALGVSI